MLSVSSRQKNLSRQDPHLPRLPRPAVGLAVGELLGRARELSFSLETSRLAQCLRFIGGLPGEVRIGPSEVTVSRGLAVDRPAQVEAFDNPLRGQLEVLPDQLL